MFQTIRGTMNSLRLRLQCHWQTDGCGVDGVVGGQTGHAFLIPFSFLQDSIATIVTIGVTVTYQHLPKSKSQASPQRSMAQLQHRSVNCEYQGEREICQQHSKVK